MGSLPVPPEVPKLIAGVVDAIGGLVKDAPKARGEPLDVVKHLVPGKTLQAEDAVEPTVDNASEGSSGATSGGSGPPVNPPTGPPAPPAPNGSSGDGPGGDVGTTG